MLRWPTRKDYVSNECVDWEVVRVRCEERRDGGIESDVENGSGR